MAIYMWREPDYLYFTANTANSTIALNKNGNPTAVTLETSTDRENRSNYTFGNTITLSNIGDKVYWRNTSTTDKNFSTGSANYYFTMTWSILWGWDISSLLNKNCTSNVSWYCYTRLFDGCTSLITAPILTAQTLKEACYYYMFNWCTWLTDAPTLPATTLANYCYADMFKGCTSLTTLPSLPATTLASYCYDSMFYWCSKIKLSTSQTWEYQTAYRIPPTWTWTTGTSALSYMLYGTWWTFTWTPTINTTYYTSNQVI